MQRQQQGRFADGREDVGVRVGEEGGGVGGKGGIGGEEGGVGGGGVVGGGGSGWR